MNIEIRTLVGRHVRLDPVTPETQDTLRPLMQAALNCDPDSWEIMATNGCGEGFDDWWGAALGESRRGERIAYAVRRLSDGQVIGTSSFLDIRRMHRSVQIGATFLQPDVRQGPINPESKRLLLSHAFDSEAVRAEFMIDVRNARSQAAVEKLGAEKEGVLRRHRITWTGHVRDTAVFSITDLDWPGVKARLDYRLTEDFV